MTTLKVGVSPYDYGALGGGNDDTDAVMNAAAAAQSDRTKCLYLDDYFICQEPVRWSTSLGAIRAAGPNCGLHGSFYGPSIVLAGTESSTPYTTAIRPDGLNQAFDWTNFQGYIVLSDYGIFGTLNGANHFMARCWYKPSSISDTYVIVGSWGSLSQNGNWDSAFSIKNVAGVHTATLKIGSTTYTLTDPTPLVAGNTYLLALTFDGSTIRLYRGDPGGTTAIVATQTASGTITQQVWEDVIIGGSYKRSFAAAGTLFQAGPNGVVQDLDIEVSNSTSVGEYTTTSFATPTFYDPGTYTKAFLMHDSGYRRINNDMITMGRTGGSVVYYPIYRRSYPASVSHVLIDGINIGNSGQGVVAHGAQDCIFRDLYAWTGGHSLVLVNNCYNTSIENPFFHPGSGGAGTCYNAAGILMNGAGWVTRISNLKTQGGAFGLVAIGSNAQVDQAYIVAQSCVPLIATGVGGGGQLSGRGVLISDEGGPTTLTAGAVFDSLDLNLSASSINFSGNNCPFAIWDHDNLSLARSVVEDCEFLSPASKPLITDRHTFRGPFANLSTSNEFRRIRATGNRIRWVTSGTAMDIIVDHI